MKELTETTMALIGLSRKEGVDSAEAWVRRRIIARCQSDRSQVSHGTQLDASIRIRLADGREGIAASSIRDLSGGDCIRIFP